MERGSKHLPLGIEQILVPAARAQDASGSVREARRLMREHYNGSLGIRPDRPNEALAPALLLSEAFRPDPADVFTGLVGLPTAHGEGKNK